MMLRGGVVLHGREGVLQTSIVFYEHGLATLLLWRVSKLRDGQGWTTPIVEYVLCLESTQWREAVDCFRMSFGVSI